MPCLVAAWLGLPAAASAQIYADFETSVGRFTIELNHLQSPQAAANFIRLAEGTADWADPETGEVFRDTPFYDGLTFYRATPGSGIAFGSRSQDGNDDPGWVFQDDTRALNTVIGYGAYMENRRDGTLIVPNNNGGRILISIPLLPVEVQQQYTLLGTVQAATFPPGGSGYDTVYGISLRPSNKVTIEDVGIRRIGGSAAGFDENAQGLPVLRAADLRLAAKAGGVYLEWADQWGSSCRFWNSDDLSDWPIRFEEPDHPGKQVLGHRLDDDFISSHPRSFFRGAEVDYPDWPSVLRPLGLALVQCEFVDFSEGAQPPTNRFQFRFNAAATGGQWFDDGVARGAFIVGSNTTTGPFTSTLEVTGQGLPSYRFDLHYDRDGLTGLTKRISRLGGINRSAPRPPRDLFGFWIYNPPP